MSAKRFVDWSFNHYLGIAHPDFASTGGPAGGRAGGRYLADSQSLPTPASTASGGSSS
jgi:hypothetical protein